MEVRGRFVSTIGRKQGCGFEVSRGSLCLGLPPVLSMVVVCEVSEICLNGLSLSMCSHFGFSCCVPGVVVPRREVV